MPASGWAAVIAAIVSLALGVSQGQAYLKKHRAYAMWWSMAFLVAGVAAVLQVVAFAHGAWPIPAYRAYVVLSSAVPGLMGAGSMYLLFPKLASWFSGLILALVALTLWGALLRISPVDMSNVLVAGEQVTKILPSAQITWGFALNGALGGLALVVGALWSYVRTRMPYNLGIALGGIIFSVSDSLSALGTPELFFAAEVVGSIALYMAVRAAAIRRVPTTVAAGEAGSPGPSAQRA